MRGLCSGGVFAKANIGLWRLDLFGRQQRGKRLQASQSITVLH